MAETPGSPIFTPKILPKLVIFGHDPPQLTARQWKLLLLLQAAGYFGAFDATIFGVAIPQIQSDLHLKDSEMNFIGSLLGFSSVISCMLSCLSDRYGRARVLKWTLLPYTIATAATALSKDAVMFTACQLVAAAFIAAEGMISHVMIIEEMPPKCRGWAVGVLNTGSACGAGLAMLLFGMLGGAWRVMYALSIVPLLGVRYLRRYLPETKRWMLQGTKAEIASKAADVSESAPEALQLGSPAMDASRTAIFTVERSSEGERLVDLWRPHHVFVIVSAFVGCFSCSAAVFLTSKHIQVTHGFSPAAYAKLAIVGGGLSLFMFNLAGYLGDRYGRKTIGTIGILVKMLVDIAFWNISSDTSAATFSIVMLFCFRTALGMGLDTNFQALCGEIFPTSMRSSAQGILAVTGGIGGPLGLLVETRLATYFAADLASASDVQTSVPAAFHAQAVRTLLLGQVLTAFIVYFGLPETRARELEEINENDGLRERSPCHLQPQL